MSNPSSGSRTGESETRKGNRVNDFRSLKRHFLPERRAVVFAEINEEEMERTYIKTADKFPVEVPLVK